MPPVLGNICPNSQKGGGGRVVLSGRPGHVPRRAQKGRGTADDKGKTFTNIMNINCFWTTGETVSNNDFIRTLLSQTTYYHYRLYREQI